MNFGAVRVNKCGLLFLVGATLIILYYAFGGGGGDVGEVVVEDASFVQQTLGNGKVSLKTLLAGAIDAAQKGGLEVVAVRKNSVNLQETVKGKTKEGVKDSATEGDFRSHKVMYYGLRKTFPQVKVISEEHTDAPTDLGEVVPASVFTALKEITANMPGDEMLNAEDVVFWIDPLDATKEYTENLLQYVMTMVGVAVKGKPIIGVLHRPFQGDTYWAVVGHGNSPNLNIAHEQVIAPHDGGLRIIVSRSHAGNVRNFTKHVLGSEEQVQIISAAGAGYKVLEVIEDRADVYVHVTAIKKWDLCAGYAILNALGGTMTTLNGEQIDFSGHKDPLNTKGILAYMKRSHAIEQLETIKINE